VDVVDSVVGSEVDLVVFLARRPATSVADPIIMPAIARPRP